MKYRTLLSDFSTNEAEVGRWVVYPCNCVGPQNGQPLCPCRMRDVQIVGGRYIIPAQDLGPAPADQPSAAPCSKCGGYGNDGDAPCQHCGQTGLEPERVADNGPDQPAAIPCPHPDVAIIDGDLCACCGQRVADNGKEDV